MNKNLLSISVFLMLIFLSSIQDSFACSCVANTKPIKMQVKEAFNTSSAVFSGEVLKISPKGEFEVMVKIKVGKSWIAKLPQEITLTTTKDSAMCGYGFEAGQKYLVYAYGKVDTLSTNNCSRTTEASNKTDLKYLNKLKGVKPKKS